MSLKSRLGVGVCMFSCGKVENTCMKPFPWPQESRKICLFALLNNKTRRCKNLLFLCFSYPCTHHISYLFTISHQLRCMIVYNAHKHNVTISHIGHPVVTEARSEWTKTYLLSHRLDFSCHCTFQL